MDHDGYDHREEYPGYGQDGRGTPPAPGYPYEQNESSGNPYGSPDQSRQNNMAFVSVVMGIVGLLTICCYGGLLFGSLGLIFGILSKNDASYCKNAKTGLIISGIALGIGLIMAAYVFSVPDPASASYGTSSLFMDLAMRGWVRGGGV